MDDNNNDFDISDFVESNSRHRNGNGKNSLVPAFILFLSLVLLLVLI